MIKMTYKIETTDPITHVHLNNLAEKPYLIEEDSSDSLIIYFENENNKNIFLNNSHTYSLCHYKNHLGFPHP